MSAHTPAISSPGSSERAVESCATWTLSKAIKFVNGLHPSARIDEMLRALEAREESRRRGQAIALSVTAMRGTQLTVARAIIGRIDLADFPQLMREIDASYWAVKPDTLVRALCLSNRFDLARYVADTKPWAHGQQDASLARRGLSGAASAVEGITLRAFYTGWPIWLRSAGNGGTVD